MTAPENVDVEIVDDVEDDWQRRQYLKQIYESHERARRAIADLDQIQSADSHHHAIVAVCDLIRLVEPLVRDHPLWDETTLSTVTKKKRTTRSHTSPPHLSGGSRVQQTEVPVEGVQGFLQHKNGFETLVEETAPGNTTNTTLEKGRKPLPPEAVEITFRHLTQFLHEQDILMAKSGEAELKDGDAL
jgi:hypothetical protein